MLSRERWRDKAAAPPLDALSQHQLLQTSFIARRKTLATRVAVPGDRARLAKPTSSTAVHCSSRRAEITERLSLGGQRDRQYKDA